MSWLFFRILLTAAAALVGAFLGNLLGAAVHGPELGTAFGAVAGAALAALVDGLRAVRLIRWLRGEDLRNGPRDPGLWGEASYRIERALRQRERDLRAEQERLAQFLAAIQASPNGVLLLDDSDLIVWCNRVAADHFGFDPERDLQQRVTNLVRAPAFVAHLQSGRDGEAVTFSQPGSAASLQVTVSRYGQGLKLVLSADITERERADAMRRDFVANVSHEIRTPLTVLAGFVETFSTLPLTEVERRKVLNLMEQQTTRMQTLVEDLLTLARLEGSPRPSTDRWVPVSRIFAQVEAEGRGLSNGRHQITVLGGEGEALAGNESEWISAVANLVSNAVRYTPEGGHIDVQWRRRPEGGAVIEVSDTGPGIAREHLGRLTERFYRVDGSRSRDTGGTGLGLSIVKHVAQRHGGELEISSEPGKGSSFRLVLPAVRIRHLGAGPGPVAGHVAGTGPAVSLSA